MKKIEWVITALVVMCVIFTVCFCYTTQEVVKNREQIEIKNGVINRLTWEVDRLTKQYHIDRFVENNKPKFKVGDIVLYECEEYTVKSCYLSNNNGIPVYRIKATNPCGGFIDCEESNVSKPIYRSLFDAGRVIYTSPAVTIDSVHLTDNKAYVKVTTGGFGAYHTATEVRR